MLACERLESTDSTQREALQRLHGRGAPGRLGERDGSGKEDSDPAGMAFAIWTTHQTQGMGSHGRRWQDSPGGGLALSIAWPEILPRISPMVPQKNIPIKTSNNDVYRSAWPARLSLLVLKCLERCYPALQARLGLKWPNDIVCADAKLAGVLVSRHLVDGHRWLIAGIGINLFWRNDPMVGRPVTDLRSLGVDQIDPTALVNEINADMEKCWRGEIVGNHWEQEFMERDVLAQESVSVMHPLTGKVLHQGRHAGITAAGELLLHTEEQTMAVQIGELSLRKALS